MTAATKAFERPGTSNRFVFIGIVAAAIMGGALLWRQGSAPVVSPVMAERAVEMPDGRKLFVQRHEITIAEWNACFAQEACTLELRARPDQNSDTTPATGLSYIDAQEYVAWINATTGHSFRLPDASEWNLMAAAVLPDEPEPLFSDPSLTWASTYLTEGIAPRTLKEQGSFSTSPEGIADLDGSVWEWTQECYAQGAAGTRCPAFFVGGEHLAAMSYLIRDPARGGCAVGTPPAHLGMRLVSDAAF